MKMSIAELHSNGDETLWETQKLYENSLDKYLEARDVHLEAELEYEHDYTEKIRELKDKGHPVTTLSQIAKGECFEQYALMNRAEAVKKRFFRQAEKYKERINSIKFLMKIKFGHLE